MTDATPTQPESTTPPPQSMQPAPQPQAATTDGLDPKVGGLLSYLLFGWIGGLIMFLTQKHPEVRFHGAQSIIFSIALFVFFIALGIVGTMFAFVPGLGFISSIVTLALYPLLWLASLILWILLCVKGYNLEHFKLPLIGDMAEKWAAK